METNLLKTITRSVCRTIVFCALAGVPILAGCGIGELEGRIDNIENRLTELEAAFQTQIDDLKSIVDGKTTVISSELDKEKKVWTVVLSNGSTIKVAEDAIGGPKVGIVEVDGKKVWALDGTPLVNGDGNNLPVEAETTPSIRINADTNCWELSADNGKTWLSTGIEASEGASIFSKVEEDENNVYFVLSDGTKLKVAKLTGSKITVLSGKQFFTPDQTKSVKVAVSNVTKEPVITKPDGWRASLDGDKLIIKAPGLDNPYAEAKGKVAIVAVGNDEKVSISEVNVEVGEAPVTITLDDKGNIEFTLREDLVGNWDFPGYTLGIATLDSFEPNVLAAELPNAERRYDAFDSESKTVSALLGVEPQKGVSYVVWACPYEQDYSGNTSYNPSDFVFEVYASQFIDFEVKDITFEDATLIINPISVDSYYGGVVELSEWNAQTVIDDIASGWGSSYERTVGAYNGPLSKYATWMTNKLYPGKTYVAFAVPDNKGEGTTMADLYYKEIAIPALVSGGSASVTIGEVTSEVTSVSADVTPGAGAYKCYGMYVPEVLPDDLMVAKLFESGSECRGETIMVKKTGLAPGAKGWIVAVAIDNEGRYGTIVRQKADAAEITFNDIVLTKGEPVVNPTSVSVEITGTADIVRYRYINMKASEWTGHYMFKGDIVATETVLAANSFYDIKEVDADGGKYTIAVDELEIEKDYKLFVIGLDNNNNPTKMIYLDYFTELSKYSKKDDARWTENYSHRPVLTNITLDGTPLSEMTEIPDGFFGEVKADIAIGEKCQNYWIYASDPLYLKNSAGPGDKGWTVAILGSWSTKEFFDSLTNQSLGYASISVDSGTGEMNYGLYVVWQDTDGYYYQYEEIDIKALLKK